MRLPSVQECRDLLREFHVPQNVIDHTEKVTKIAVFLATRLNEKGVSVDVDLVHRASLLHDLYKFLDFKELSCGSGRRFEPHVMEKWKGLQKVCGDMSHEEACFRHFEKDYPQVARVILAHGYAQVRTQHAPKTWAEKIVTYADKRVKHDEIVSLKERFEDGRKRYGVARTPETDAIDAEYYKIELEIFGILDMEPDRIEAYM
jgi:uncharacterized protein